MANRLSGLLNQLLPWFFGFSLFWTISPFPFPFGNQDPYFFWSYNTSLNQFLQKDFLSAQPDPFPLFSILFKYLPAWFYPIASHLIFFLLAVVYFVSFSKLLQGKLNRQTWILPGLFLVAHSSFVWSGFMNHAFNLDLRWFWHHGIAGQGLLFGYLQPSAWGVFLLLALVYAMQQKWKGFLICLSIAGAFHANYILLGGMILLVVFYYYPKKILAEWPLLLCLSVAWLPYLVYSYTYFKPNNTEFKLASEYFIQNNPHLDPLHWLNLETYFKAGFMVVVFGFFTRNWHRQVLLAILGLCLVLSILALVWKNVFLINLAPWRMSVILMPVALFLFLSKLSDWLSASPKVAGLIAGLFLGILAAELSFKVFGNLNPNFVETWKKLAFQGILIAALLGIGLAYLPKSQNLAIALLVLALPALGVLQHRFETMELAKLPEWEAEKELRSTPDANRVLLFPLEFKSVRLRAKTAVYIDANVYFSPALPEWKRRQEWNLAFFKNPKSFSKTAIRQQGITHLLCNKNISLTDSVWELQKSYSHLHLYKLHEP